jgi:two-component system, LytTR family, response regulator
MLRILIIEDEPATARNLHFTLQDTGEEISLLATLHSVKTAVDWLNENPLACDLVFMDIRLADGLSFEIFEQAEVNCPVVFVTAYDEYALKAFKANGIDYILKPLDKYDLQQALKKFNSFHKPPVVNEHHGHLQHVASLIKAAYNNYKQSFLVHFRDKLVPVSAKDIVWFYTVNEVTFAMSADNRKFIVDFTLEQLQQQLDPWLFFRANRQFIIQRKAIVEVDFYFNGRLLLKTAPASEENILISKARAPEFKTWMNS